VAYASYGKNGAARQAINDIDIGAAGVVVNIMTSGMTSA